MLIPSVLRYVSIPTKPVLMTIGSYVYVQTRGLWRLCNVSTPVSTGGNPRREEGIFGHPCTIRRLIIQGGTMLRDDFYHV